MLKEEFTVGLSIQSNWVYDIYNTVNFGTFDEVVAQDKVSVMNQRRRIYSNI